MHTLLFILVSTAYSNSFFVVILRLKSSILVSVSILDFCKEILRNIKVLTLPLSSRKAFIHRAAVTATTLCAEFYWKRVATATPRNLSSTFSFMPNSTINGHNKEAIFI